MSLEELTGLENENCSREPYVASYTKSKEEMPNIFEEIEQLLNQNQCLENCPDVVLLSPMNIRGKNTFSNGVSNTEANNVQSVNFNVTGDTGITLDFLPAHDNHEFIIPSLPEEELSLYSVNQNELQPVNSPFMVPGIYKKITNAPAAIDLSPPQSASINVPNVFLSTKWSKGRIVSRTEFENCAVTEESTEQQPSNIESHFSVEAKSLPFIDQPLNALSKFAHRVHKFAECDHIVIDNNRNEIIRTRINNKQKVIYRLLGPSDLGLQTQMGGTNTATSRLKNQPVKLKIGRPKKRPTECENKQIVLLKKPKADQTAKLVDASNTVASFHHPVLRTRSGRVVKLVKHNLKGRDAHDTHNVEPEHIQSLIKDIQDKDFHCSKSTDSLSLAPANEEHLPPPLASSSPVHKRRVPPEAVCPKCGKIFLGRRLKRHFTQHPDHMISTTAQNPPTQETKPPNNCDAESTPEDYTLFRFLISKLQKPQLNEDQRADLFLNELNDLVEQLQLRNTRLIRNTSGLHFVNARTARVLGIPEGQYALDMSAIKAEAPPPEVDHRGLNGDEQKSRTIIPPIVAVNTRSLDYTAISLDDTLTDEAAQKLNLSAGGKLLPPSEESLLRAVDDLVHDGITKLVDANLLHPPRNVVQSSLSTTLMPHYDHVNDNAVEALTIKEDNGPQRVTPLLDLSMDFFQFKNN